MHVGEMLDYLYPDWAYQKQRYDVRSGQVDKSRMVSYHRGGARSPYSVHVKSMSEFNNKDGISAQLIESAKNYENHVKSIK